MVEDGGTLILEGDGVDWVAAGHSDVLATDDGIYHLYHAYEQGSNAAVFRVAELMFDDEGWPVPHAP